MKRIIILFILIHSVAFARESFTLQGHFPKFPNSNYVLKGFYGMESITLSTARSGEDGEFLLTYPKNYKGVAELHMNGAYAHLFILNKEDIKIYWEDLARKDSARISGSKEYDAFLQGMRIFQNTEAKLAAWNYLLPLYENETLKYKKYKRELDTVNDQYPAYVKSLPEHLWVRQYLLTKGLIEQMPATVKSYPWRVHQHIVEFDAIDLSALKNSGLYKALFEGYTHLVERLPLEEINPLLESAIDKLIKELQHNPPIQQAIAQHWHQLLERRSLFSAAEYLSSTILNKEK